MLPTDMHVCIGNLYSMLFDLINCSYRFWSPALLSTSLVSDSTSGGNLLCKPDLIIEDLRITYVV